MHTLLVYMCMSPKYTSLLYLTNFIDYLYTLYFTFAYITIFLSSCAMLHISIFSIPLSFLTMADNLHDIRPHQTAHSLVCAKKGEEVRFFGNGDKIEVHRSLSALLDLVFHFEHARPFNTNHCIRRTSSSHGLHPIRHIQRSCLPPQIRPTERRCRPGHSDFVHRICSSIGSLVTPIVRRIPCLTCRVCPSFGSTVSSSRIPWHADSLLSTLAFRRLFPCVDVVPRICARSLVLT